MSACFSAAAMTRYGQMLDSPYNGSCDLYDHTVEFFFCIDALGKIWSKSDKRLRRYYVIFVAMKNTKNYAQTESDSCHTANAVDN